MEQALFLLAPFLIAMLLWWSLTGAVLWAARRRPAGQRQSMGVATLGCLAGLVIASESAQMPSLIGSYLGFSSVLMIWCWIELAFLLGWVSGPNRLPCPPHSKGWNRLVMAVGTILHHEIALLLAGFAICLPAWNAPNTTAAQVFLVMYAMRLSTKLNLFWGVRNFYEGFLPGPTSHLSSYFRKRGLTPLFAVTAVLVSALTVLAWQQALMIQPSWAQARDAFVASLFTLSLLEHLLLVLPIRPERLWRMG
jgi:putative photosynthetic complex assembly protein 2